MLHARGKHKQALRCLVIMVSLLIPSGAATRCVSQAQETHGESFKLPLACREVSKSNRRIAGLLSAAAAYPSAETYKALGAVYAGRGKTSCAIPAFEQALRLNPSDWRARYNLALALIKEGKDSKAADHLRTLIQQKPESPEVHNVL